jgi:hypothetical protein
MGAPGALSLRQIGTFFNCMQFFLLRVETAYEQIDQTFALSKKGVDVAKLIKP